MLFLPEKINHLIRYFFILGVITVSIYWLGPENDISFMFIGPPIFIAAWTKNLIMQSLNVLPEGINNSYFLIPMTIFYFSFIGFLFKQLWNESGTARFISIFAFAGFLLYIHFKTWQMLVGYYTPHI